MAAIHISQRLLSALLVVGALTVLALSSGRAGLADTGVTDPATGHIQQLAIDVDPTGNAPGTGTTGSGCPGSPCAVTHLGVVDTEVGSVPIGTTVTVDVIVDEISLADGNATGFGFDLHYDPVTVSIHGHNADFMVSNGFEPGTVNDPDSSGDWRVDYKSLDGGSHSGEGVLVRFGVRCEAVGWSSLTLTNAGVFTSNNTNGDPNVAVTPDRLAGAYIYCGMPGHGLADLTVASIGVASAPSASIGAQFDVSVDGTIRNLGYVWGATADVLETLNMPSDCTAMGGSSRMINGIALPSSTPVALPQQVFSVSCMQPSFHTFTGTASVSISPSDPGHVDPISFNNQGTSAGSTTAILTMADLTLGAINVSVVPAQAIAGTPFPVSASISTTDNGPYGPLTADDTVTLQAPADCTILTANPAASSASVPLMGTTMIPASWSVLCSMMGMHDFSADVSAAADNPHISETNPGDNQTAGSASAFVSNDMDGDGVASAVDNCPMTANQNQVNSDTDQWGDACDGCPNVATLWMTPIGDDDCDGFSTTVETFMGTTSAVKCAATAAVDDEPVPGMNIGPDMWPVDFNDDQKSNLSDVLKFSPHFNSTGPNPPYDVRYDLNGDNHINLSDILTISPFFNKSCSP